MVRSKDEAKAGVGMVALVVVGMVVLLGVEPGASREKFEEWSDPGGMKREVGEEGADGVHTVLRKTEKKGEDR